MADPITEELALDLSQALRDVNRLDDVLSRMAQSFKVDLADAISVLRESVEPNVDTEAIATGIERAIVEGTATPAVVEADADAVTEGVTGAIDTATSEPAVIDGDAADVEASVTDAIDTATADPAVIDGDAAGITDAIDTAVDAANSEISLDGDAGAVTDAIDAAVDAANSELSVTADVSSAEAAIDALTGEQVDILVGADTADADEALTALGQSAETAAGGMDTLNTSSDIFVGIAGTAVGNAATLQNTIGRLGPGAQTAATAVGALATFIGVATANAIDAETATNRFNTQLGATADQVDNLDIGGLNTDISTLALNLGSSDDAMRDAAASIAQFGTSAGASREDIAQTSEEILALAARAVALDPALGDVGAVAGELSNALASGRDRALIPYGIALDKAAVAAEAQRRATADGRTEISAWDKIAAGASLTAGRLGTAIGEDVAAGAEKSEIRMRGLRVAIDEALESFGAPLVAPVLEVLEAAVPSAIAFGDVLSQIAEATLPSLVPLLNVTADVLGLVAAVLDGIPAPVLAGVAAFALLTQTMRTLIGLLPASAAGFAGALGPIAGFVVAAGAVATVVSSIGRADEDAARAQEEFRQSMFGSADEATALSGALETLREELGENLAELRSGGEFSQLLAENLEGLGLNAANLTRIVQLSDEEFVSWKQSLQDASVETHGLVGDIDIANDVIDELRKQTQDAARTTLDMAVQTEAVSDAQRDAAIAANTAADGTVNYAAALDEAATLAERAAEQQRQVAVANAEATGSFDDLRAAIIAGNDVDIDQWAEDLGVAAEDIEAKIADARQELESFVSSALSELPVAADAFDDWQKAGADAFEALKRASEEDGGDVEAAFLRVVEATDPQRLVENIAQQAAAIRDFQTNIQTLLAEGLTNVAEFLIGQGPVVGGAIAQSLVDPESNRLALELTLADLDIATAEYENFIRTQGAPRVLGATSDMALDASNAFAGLYRLDTGKPIVDAEAEVQRRGGILSRATGDLGNRSEREFASRFGIRSFAVGEIDGTATDITGRSAALGSAAAGVGGAGATGFQQGFRPQDHVAGAFAAVGVATSLEAIVLLSNARIAGSDIGFEFTEGLRLAISSSGARARIVAAAAALAAAAAAAARRALGISSPSAVMFEVGQQTAEGFALGLGDPRLIADIGATADAIAQAAIPDARQLSAALDARISGLSLPPVQLAVEGSAAGSSGTVEVNVTIGQIVVGSGTPAEVAQVGERIADAAADALARRNVIARVRTG